MKKNGEFVGVDDKYIPENEKYVDDSMLGNKEESARKVKKVAKGIGIGYICWCVFITALTVGIIIFVFMMFNNVRKEMSLAKQKQDDMSSSFHQQQSQTELQWEKDSFNTKFEIYSGTKGGLLVTTLLDNVVNSNKTNSDKVITVIYNTNSITEPNEIVEMKKSFEKWKEYEVMLDYDTNGFVNKVTIKDI